MFDTLVIGIGVFLLLVWTIEVVFPKQKGSILPKWFFPKEKPKSKSKAQKLGDALADVLTEFMGKN